VSKQQHQEDEASHNIPKIKLSHAMPQFVLNPGEESVEKWEGGSLIFPAYLLISLKP
jgi:hypothetical protein